ncbi:hypothetical protein KA025_02530 [Candidatus Saccharibacteria bacterium]|nr:hypothetical protein [Candidatus Saccharibacteria bacterium]
MSIYNNQKNGLQLNTLVDATSVASTTFVGTAIQGSLTSAAKWSIQKIVTSGNDVTMTSNSEGEFNGIWDRRLTTTYN